MGGEPEFWKTVNSGYELHCINLDKIEFNADDYQVNLRTSAGDCCELTEEEDDSYDLVYSNSVIEHVGDFERQKQFADNALRLGQKLWVQSPAKCFQIEPHWYAFFIHWFPKKYQYLHSLYRRESLLILKKCTTLERLSHYNFVALK